MLVEGNTEQQYLRHWAVLNRGSVIVAFDDRRGLAPLTMVRAAIVAKRRDEPDETWCVFDHDDAPNLNDALVLAQPKGLASRSPSRASSCG